jgi:hypothetical protein
MNQVASEAGGGSLDADNAALNSLTGKKRETMTDLGHWALLAACLGGGTGAYASHHSAAQLWDLERYFPDELEITIPGRRRVRLEGVRVHNTELAMTEHTTIHDGVPVSSPARTLRDLTAVVGEAEDAAAAAGESGADGEAGEEISAVPIWNRSASRFSTG